MLTWSLWLQCKRRGAAPLMRPRTKKAKSIEQENFLAARLNGQRSRSSGANPFDLGDVVADAWLGEAKYTDKYSISLKKSVWEKIHDEAYARGKKPFIGIRYRNEYTHTNLDLIVLDLNDFLELANG